MTLSSQHSVDFELVEDLLVLTTLEEQSAFLQAADLLNAHGLDLLLDLADQLVYSDPGKAHRLAILCAEVADRAAAPAAVPRAAYIRLATHAENGEFDAALRMAKAAHDGYLTLGEDLKALRTHIGRMSVLLELGLYQEAIDCGQIVLDALDGGGELDVSATQRQSDLLAALVHQNLGGCFEYTGRYDKALDAYAVAEERYKALGNTERSAGNDDNTVAQYPAAGEGVVAVTSVDRHEKKSDFASYGAWVDISAPGTEIYSAFPVSELASGSGTSMATPFVSGQAALIHDVDGSLDPARIETLIRDTARSLDVNNPNYVGMLGAGESDIGASLGQLRPGSECGGAAGSGDGADDLGDDEND